jgi:hypothetical protein
MNQRWSYGRDHYRHDGEPIDPRDYEVAPIASDGPARAFVESNHYSNSYPAARWRFGMYRRGQLVGVAVFSHPASDKVLTNAFAIEAATDAVELGRFVLLPCVPGNGETWFLSRCHRILRREGLAGVVSFSDPTRRTNAAGLVVFGGHYGCIYQASSARFCGRSKARTLRLLPNGTVLSDRAIQKIRQAEQGVAYSVAQLVAFGAAQPARLEPGVLGPWLASWLPRLTRTVRHPGNLRYCFPFGRTQLRMPVQAYPKPRDLGLAS